MRKDREISTTLCACGCGEPVIVGKQFLRGHYSRTLSAKQGYAARKTVIPAPNPSGICQCGCGQQTPLAAKDSIERGYRIGEPLKFVHGHELHALRREKSHKWKGGRFTHKTGYVLVHTPDHPNADKRGYVPEHRLVVEAKLGRLLDRHEHVHHINGIKDDNRIENLIALTHSEHLKLHAGAGLKRFYAEHPEARSENGKVAARKRYAKNK